MQEPSVAAARLLGFVDQTAGLLIGRGGAKGNVYAFPHRTFQEYFAGCHLAKGSRDFKRVLVELLPQGDYWRLAGQLGVEELSYNDNHDGPAMDLVYHLCPEKEPALGHISAWRGISWAPFFALEIGVNRIQQDENGGGGPEFIERLRGRLVKILEQGLLPSRERADAGFVLGKLGDPRPGVCDFDPRMWVALPGGKFIMGDKDYGPPHEVELSPFNLSKYPIINAQFKKFIQAGGYEGKRWWSEEGWKYREKEKLEQPRWWDDDDFNLPNQPVVGVSWFEAEAFCNWITAQGIVLSAEGKKQIVRLPTEAEWEFAARGKEGRIYPWGPDAPKPEHANYEDSKIGRPTAVGSYRLGKTPEDVFDLAGNAWEWCQDWYDDKYYAQCKKQKLVKNPTGPKKGDWHIVRGGSYYWNANDLRGSRRNWVNPDYWNHYAGFRVCVGEL